MTDAPELHPMREWRTADRRIPCCQEDMYHRQSLMGSSTYIALGLGVALHDRSQLWAVIGFRAASRVQSRIYSLRSILGCCDTHILYRHILPPRMLLKVAVHGP